MKAPTTIAFVAHAGALREMDAGTAYQLASAAARSRAGGQWRPDPIFVTVQGLRAGVALPGPDGEPRWCWIATAKPHRAAVAAMVVGAVLAVAHFGAACGQPRMSPEDVDAAWQAALVRRHGPPEA